MWKDEYSVLRTNGVLFVAGFLFMSALAALGSVLEPAVPARDAALSVEASALDDRSDYSGLATLVAELPGDGY